MSDMQGQPADRRWSAFAVCLAAGFLTLLDVSIVNVALPSMEATLATSPAQVQWIVAGYTLAFGLVLVPAGRIGDLFGRRELFLIGVAGFTLTSALCAAAPTAEFLSVARVLQGAAAGALSPQVLALIQELFAGAERGRAFGFYGATVGVATAIGPILGGALIALFGPESGWRAVFWVNVPVGIVVVVLGCNLLPRVRPSRTKTGLDLPGLVLLALAVVALMLPFVAAAEGGGPGQVPWWLLAVSAAAGAGFVAWERRLEHRGGQPVIASDLLAASSYTRGALVAMLYFAAFTGIFLISTLYLQSGLGLAPWQAGLVFIPFSLVGAASAWLGGRWVARAGRPMVVAGIAAVAVCIIAADVLVHFVDGPAAAYWITAIFTLGGLGNGLVISPNQTLTLSNVPLPRAGVAGGALQTGQRIGSATGVAASSALFFAALARTSDYSQAMSAGLRVVLALLVLSLAVALADLRARHRDPPGSSERLTGA